MWKLERPPPPRKGSFMGHRRHSPWALITPAEAAPSDVQPAPALPVSQLDIRVGKILEVGKHPDADRFAPAHG